MNIRKPIGIELIKREIITEKDLDLALIYQKSHPEKRLGDIINILNLCPQKELIDAIGEILNEKGILLSIDDINVNPYDFLPIEICKKYKVIVFDKIGNKVKVCFSNLFDERIIDEVRKFISEKNLLMEKYITFDTNLENIFKYLDENKSVEINTSSEDIVNLVDTIIKKGIEKRASDIHIEPLGSSLRIRFRIDGELITIANIDKKSYSQLAGRIKALSDMYQEKQEAQDGRINIYDDYDIRVSSQRTINGEKFTLRLLKTNSDLKNIFDLGLIIDDKEIRKCFDKRNSITIIAAPTGEGKTTTLYGVLDYLNRPEINITTVEEPVEIKVDGINQIEVDNNISFSTALKSILRNDPDIILIGEIRDKETAEIAIQAGQTGHYVLSTIHTTDAIEVITRLRKIGISDYDIASILATSVSQRLVRKICYNCAIKREFSDDEKIIINSLAGKYNVQFDFNGKFTYDIKGCKDCNYTGYYDRTGIFEILQMSNSIKEMISNGESTIKIKDEAIKQGYLPLEIDGLRKVVDGITTLDEINKRLLLF